MFFVFFLLKYSHFFFFFYHCSSGNSLCEWNKCFKVVRCHSGGAADWIAADSEKGRSEKKVTVRAQPLCVCVCVGQGESECVC